jgi:hypothetical protein
MNNKNMEKIALELWTSQYDVKGTLFTTSSILEIIEYDSFNKPRDIFKDFIFYNWKFRKVDNFDHHLFQFQVWKTSMKAKFLTEGLFLLILTCIFQYFLMQATQAATKVDGTRNSYNEDDEDDDDKGNKVKSFNLQAVTYYNHTQITILLAWISLTFPIRIFLTMNFAKISKRRYQLLTATNILDILIFTVFSIRLYFEYTYFTNGLGNNKLSDGAKESDGVIYYDNVYRDSNYSNDVDYLYSIGSA